MTMTQVILSEKLYTVAEFKKMPELHGRYELIEGRLIEKPLPKYGHSDIAFIFINAYIMFDPQQKLGRMRFDASVDLNSANSPIPDVCYWTHERRPRDRDEIAPSPDLAIEVWSEHDLETKERLKAAREKCERYILNGVRLVWAVNPKNQTVEIYRPGENGRVQVETAGVDAVLDSGEVARGFSIAVRRLFEDEADDE